MPTRVRAPPSSRSPADPCARSVAGSCAESVAANTGTLASFDAEAYNEYFGNVKLFSENGNYPGGWSQPQFEEINSGSGTGLSETLDWIPAPQVYSANQAGYQNQALADGSASWTNVTCTTDSAAASPPWNSCSYATGAIGYGAWNSNEFHSWGNGNWYNKWSPA